MRKPRMFLLLSEIWSMTDGCDLRRVVELAVEAEKAGFDGVMIGEHVVSGANSAINGIPRNPRDWLRVGNQPPMYPHPSSLHLLAAIAARTSHVRLLAAALLTPLRHPLLMAKELATVDLISRGRLIILPSVSWQEEEYAALNVPFHKRGKILDEQLQIWEQLWTNGSPVSHHGEIFQFENVYVEPQPYRPGGPAKWFGGRGLKPHLLRRAVRYGQGYFPVVPLTPDETAQLQDALRAAGRNPDDFEMGAMLPGAPFQGADDLLDVDEALAPVPELWDRGVSTFLVKPSVFMDDDAGIGDFCREVVRKVDTLVA